MFTLCSFSKLVDYLFLYSEYPGSEQELPKFLTYLLSFLQNSYLGSTVLIDHSNCQYNSDHSDLTMGNLGRGGGVISNIVK